MTTPTLTKEQQEARRQKMLEDEYTFAFAFTDRRGRAWTGTFTSVIPSIGVRADIGARRANLNQGLLNMDATTDAMNATVARLDICLKKEGRPEWAKDFTKLKDSAVLFALWSEVADHETTFLGTAEPEGEGEAAV